MHGKSERKNIYFIGQQVQGRKKNNGVWFYSWARTSPVSVANRIQRKKTRIVKARNHGLWLVKKNECRLCLVIVV